MTRTRAVWILALLLSLTAAAQESKPTFDVTSVRRSNASEGSAAPFQFSPGRFVSKNVPIRLVIGFLYTGNDGYVADRVLGGPRWLDTDGYDLEGKALEGNPSQDTLRSMARSLLEDRFELKIRREIQQGPVYELVVADANGKFGPQFNVSSGDDCTTDARSAFARKVPVCGLGLIATPTEMGVRGYNITMDQIARHLKVVAGRPVIDRTGLSGAFSFSVSVPRQEESSSSVIGGASTPDGLRALVPAVVREQLGLRLVPATGPVEVLVIDSVQRPAEN